MNCLVLVTGLNGYGMMRMRTCIGVRCDISTFVLIAKELSEKWQNCIQEVRKHKLLYLRCRIISVLVSVNVEFLKFMEMENLFSVGESQKCACSWQSWRLTSGVDRSFPSLSRKVTRQISD